MNKAELTRLQSYLQRVLGAPGITLNAMGGDEAQVQVGGKTIADLTKDEDEGEVSYFFNMGLERAQGTTKVGPLDQGERVRLQSLLQNLFGAPGLNVRPRPRKTDSAEVYVGEEFIGTLSADEAPGRIGYYLTMSILDIDLE